LKKLVSWYLILRMCNFPIFAIWSIFLRAIRGEGEPNIWYCSEQTNCYMFNDAVTTLRGAQSYCRKFDSNLTSITSGEENENVAVLCGCQSCWIGLVMGTEGDWHWLDGNNSTYRNWYSEPTGNGATVMNLNNPRGGKFEIDGRWFDISTGFKGAVALCKLKKATDIPSAVVFKKLASEREECENPFNWIQ